ncbi:MAG: hypothetical protein KGJ13_10485 [Patescibacteria group bacterium]|nr:hypothetical protein [Patescibacteria group bacterium]
MPTWLADLFNPAGAIGSIVSRILDFIPNPEEKAKAQLQLQQAIITAALQADADQRAINKTEASSASLFVAGWRPAVGWLCVIALGYQWLFVPLLSWVVLLIGQKIPSPPHIGNEDIQALLYALLGIGSLRTADKLIPGGATNAIKGIFRKS